MIIIIIIIVLHGRLCCLLFVTKLTIEIINFILMVHSFVALLLTPLIVVNSIAYFILGVDSL